MPGLSPVAAVLPEFHAVARWSSTRLHRCRTCPALAVRSARTSCRYRGRCPAAWLPPTSARACRPDIGAGRFLSLFVIGNAGRFCVVTGGGCSRFGWFFWGTTHLLRLSGCRLASAATRPHPSSHGGRAAHRQKRKRPEQSLAFEWVWNVATITATPTAFRPWG